MAVWSGCGTGGAGPSASPEKSGTIRASFLTTTDPDVAAIRIDVAAGGAVVQSQTIAPGSITLPGTSQPQEGGDALFVLSPGAYQVSATPLDAAGKPSSACTVASALASVAASVTTEIVLTILCGDANGGLDVVVTVDHNPVITGLTIEPSKFIPVCDQVTVDVAAHGAPGAVLTYAWAVTTSPPGAVFQLTPSGPEAVFSPVTPGDYALTVKVSDPAGHSTSLTFPIHAEPGPLCQGPASRPLEFVTVESALVTGAPFPHFEPDFDDETNADFFHVPTGPFVPGTPTPTATGAIAAPFGDPPAIDFMVNNGIGIGQSTVGEPSGASGGGVVFVTSNWFAAYSTNGGATFTQLDPTTIFPNDAVGFCCDQIVQYAPSIDRFIWLLQGNGMRIAVASPAQIIASKGTAWTYWNLTPDVFGQPAGTGVDYPDLSLGDSNLFMSWDNGFGCPAGCTQGLQVTRTSLAGLQAGGTITLGFTHPEDSRNAWGGHVSQDTGNEVFWAAQNNTSSMRIFSLMDSSNTYFWQNVGISSWSNSGISSTTPDGQDWLNKLSGFPGSAVIGLTRTGNQVWFAWSAGTDRNFSQPHVEIVTMNIDGANPPHLSVAQQVQVWNDSYAFAYPALATNQCTGEVGMSFEYGGNGNYENHVVGFWGDFIAYITTGSNLGTTRFGDYVTIRQAPRTADNPGNLFDAFGYGLNKLPPPGGGTKVDIHYVQFGRPPSSCIILQ
jgi:hypothetical protein